MSIQEELAQTFGRLLGREVAVERSFSQTKNNPPKGPACSFSYEIRSQNMFGTGRLNILLSRSLASNLIHFMAGGTLLREPREEKPLSRLERAILKRVSDDLVRSLVEIRSGELAEKNKFRIDSGDGAGTLYLNVEGLPLQMNHRLNVAVGDKLVPNADLARLIASCQDVLRDTPDHHLKSWFAAESPQLIAVTMSLLAPARSSRLLTAFSETAACEIGLRMTYLTGVHHRIFTAIQSYLSALKERGESFVEVRNISVLQEMLRQVPAARRERLLRLMKRSEDERFPSAARELSR